MDAGIREREKYRDITWLMPSVNLDNALLKLSVITDHRNGNEIRAFCPDHHLFTGRKSSDPNWTLNTDTGETFCFTEARGSNLVWTVCRLLKCEPDAAAMFLTGKATVSEMQALEIAANQARTAKLWETKDTRKKPEPIKGIDAIRKDVENRKISEEAYQFFIHPPGKMYPTNIRRETVDRYRVFERTWGFYANRVLIPYFMRGQIVGFCAIDLLGKEAWKKAHPTQDEKAYRKVRYPENFLSTDCLFGFDDCKKDEEFIIITEGAREVMKLTQEGFPAVAILGSYLSDRHWTLLTELHPKRLILMFDGDSVGEAITKRVAKALAQNYAGNRIQQCFPPKGRDPKTLDHAELLGLLEKS